MALSELMASRNMDLKRKLSPRASSAAARDNSQPVSAGRSFIELNSVPDEDVDHFLGGEAGNSSSTLPKAENTLLDEVGEVTPIVFGRFEPTRVIRRTVDDVWREIVAGKKKEKKPKEEMMTLEDFLAKTGAAEEEASVTGVKEEQVCGGIFAYETKSDVAGLDVGLGLGVEVGGLCRGEGKRSMSLLEPLDKAAQQRQRRMIKNRESAARSRERKQAYQVRLESMVVKLEEINERFRRENAEQTKKRLKQLMENVIPVVEKRKPPRLRRVRSIQW